MAFRLKSHDSVGKGLRRVIDKQLRAAEQELREAKPSRGGIHKARTSVKKTRAVLRLFRNELGHRYKSSNGHLRKAAHLLSDLRDAEATLETLLDVRARYRSVLAHAALSPIVTRLRNKRDAAMSAAADHVRDAASHLHHVRRRAPNAVLRVASAKTLAEGAADGYRRAREAMRGLDASSEDDAFHSWRRRVKDHWYQVRLFEGLHKAAARRAKRLEELEQLLGDEHNLVILRLTLLSEPRGGADAKTMALVLGCLAEYQASLRQQTLKAGRGLFRDRPAVMNRSFGEWLRDV